MTHLTGPRPKIVKALAKEITVLLLTPGLSISESVRGCSEGIRACLHVMEDITKKLLKLSGIEKDCTTCPKPKGRPRAKSSSRKSSIEGRAAR